MTVFVLTHQDVSDDVLFTDVIKVYDNKEKAEAAFKVRVEQYEEYYDNEDYEIAEDEGYFELWKEGYWTSDHVVIKIFEEEVA